MKGERSNTVPAAAALLLIPLLALPGLGRPAGAVESGLFEVIPKWVRSASIWLSGRQGHQKAGAEYQPDSVDSECRNRSSIVAHPG
jgi:hypothetical protein